MNTTAFTGTGTRPIVGSVSIRSIPLECRVSLVFAAVPDRPHSGKGPRPMPRSNASRLRFPGAYLCSINTRSWRPEVQGIWLVGMLSFHWHRGREWVSGEEEHDKPRDPREFPQG